jgi:hypothetical protein
MTENGQFLCVGSKKAIEKISNFECRRTAVGWCLGKEGRKREKEEKKGREGKAGKKGREGRKEQ